MIDKNVSREIIENIVNDFKIQLDNYNVKIKKSQDAINQAKARIEEINKLENTADNVFSPYASYIPDEGELDSLNETIVKHTKYISDIQNFIVKLETKISDLNKVIEYLNSLDKKSSTIVNNEENELDVINIWNDQKKDDRRSLFNFVIEEENDESGQSDSLDKKDNDINVKVIQNNENKSGERSIKEENINKEIYRKLDVLEKMLPSDPLRVKVELQNIVNNI